jgi:release factor glutamine methyltransferase
MAARVNAWLNGLTITAVRGDLFSAVDGRRFDLIVSNPPYVPGEELPSRGAARAWEAGPRGREFIDRICTEAPSHLNPGGVLLLAHSSLCGESETGAALTRRGLRVCVVARRRGPLGGRLRARAQWLRQRGLLAGEEHEDIIVIRGQTTRA